MDAYARRFGSGSSVHLRGELVSLASLFGEYHVPVMNFSSFAPFASIARHSFLMEMENQLRELCLH